MQTLTWRTSTYSPNGSNCVEIATTPVTILVRDSKAPARPHLAFSLPAWGRFLPHGKSHAVR